MKMRLSEALSGPEAEYAHGDWQKMLEELDECVYELVSSAESAAHDLAGPGARSAERAARDEYKAKLRQLRMAVEEALDDAASAAREDGISTARSY